MRNFIGSLLLSIALYLLEPYWVPGNSIDKDYETLYWEAQSHINELYS